jgi:uncharacterized membrane protein
MIFINLTDNKNNKIKMSKIDEVITYGYKFDMGRYMSTGWDNFKQGAGNYVGFTVLYFIIIFMVFLASIVIPFVNIVSTAIQYALIAGLFIFTRNMLNGRENFGDFFNGFSNFGQIILFWLVFILFMMPAFIVFVIYLIPEDFISAIMSGNQDPQFWADIFENMFAERVGSIVFLYLALILYLIYLYVSYSFTLVLIADRGLGFWEAMESSRKVISKNFFYFLGMYIVMAVLLTIGTAITCGLGVLILLPYFYNVVFAAYDDIIGPEADENIDDQTIEEFGSELS